MKKTIGRLGAFSLLLSNLAFYNPAALAADEPAINYVKINETIVAILADVAAGDDIVSKVEMSIDPAFSDVVNDRLKLVLATDLRKTLWSEAPTRFATLIEGEAKLVGEAETKALEAKLGIRFDVETEAVPMLRNVSLLAREAAGCARIRVSEIGKKFVCDKLAELAQVANLDAVGALLVGVRDGMLSMVEEDLVRLRAELAEAQAPEDRERLEKLIAQDLAVLAFVNALGLATETGADGRVTGIRVTTGAPLAFGEKARLEMAEIALTDAKLSFGIGLFLRELMTAESYLAFKGEIVDMLRKVEAGDAAALEQVKNYAVTYMALVKGYTNP